MFSFTPPRVGAGVQCTTLEAADNVSAFVLGRPLFHAFFRLCYFPVMITRTNAHFPIILQVLEYSCLAKNASHLMFYRVGDAWCSMFYTSYTTLFSSVNQLTKYNKSINYDSGN